VTGSKDMAAVVIVLVAAMIGANYGAKPGAVSVLHQGPLGLKRLRG